MISPQIGFQYHVVFPHIPPHKTNSKGKTGNQAKGEHRIHQRHQRLRTPAIAVLTKKLAKVVQTTIHKPQSTCNPHKDLVFQRSASEPARPRFPLSGFFSKRALSVFMSLNITNSQQGHGKLVIPSLIIIS